MWKYVGTYDKNTSQEEKDALIAKAVEDNARDFYEDEIIEINQTIYDALCFVSEQSNETAYQESLFSHSINMLRVLTEIEPENSDLITAGILFYCPKDEIKERFGENVYDILVAFENVQLEGNTTFPVLLMADVIADQRYLISQYADIGEKLWDIFNRDKAQIYFASAQYFLSKMHDYNNTRPAYLEMVANYKKMFATHYVNLDNRLINKQKEKEILINKIINSTAETNDYESSINEIDPSIYDAIIYASEHHDHKTEFGESSFLHGINMMQVLSCLAPENKALIVTGILYGCQSLDEIKERFGEEVLEVIYTYSQEYEDDTNTFSFMLLADTIANQRYLLSRYAEIGEALWSELNKDTTQGLLAERYELLYDFQNYDNTKDLYWEMVDDYRNLFVTYYISSDNETLYQVHATERFRMDKNDPVWVDENVIPGGVQQLDHQTAERISEKWQTIADIPPYNDFSCTVYSGEEGNLNITEDDGNIYFVGMDIFVDGAVEEKPILFLEQGDCNYFFNAIRHQIGTELDEIDAMLSEMFSASSKIATTGLILEFFLKHKHMHPKIRVGPYMYALGNIHFIEPESDNLQ